MEKHHGNQKYIWGRGLLTLWLFVHRPIIEGSLIRTPNKSDSLLIQYITPVVWLFKLFKSHHDVGSHVVF